MPSNSPEREREYQYARWGLKLLPQGGGFFFSSNCNGRNIACNLRNRLHLPAIAIWTHSATLGQQFVTRDEQNYKIIKFLYCL